MPVTTGVEVRGGDTVVVKRASGDDDAVEMLRREGDRLARASHPGVAPLVRSGPLGDGWELVLAHGGRSLAGLRRPGPGPIAAILAGVASTLADLHEMGIVHGRVDASHVLLGEHDRPVLCGFGDGRDPARPEDDVAAVGELLAELLGTDEAPEPIPDRRWRTRRWDGWERRALLLLADQATAEEPQRRPTARRLAAAIAEAVPAANTASRAAADDDHDPDPIERLRPATDGSGPVRRAPALGLAAAGAVLAVLAVGRLRASDPAALTAREVEIPSAEVEVAAPVPGSILVSDGKRFRVGEEGDHLLVGDWRCDGQPTPAAFRPSTHEVFVFDHWAAEEPLAVEATATVVDAVSMVAERGDDGCQQLSVETASGAAVPIEPS